MSEAYPNTVTTYFYLNETLNLCPLILPQNNQNLLLDRRDRSIRLLKCGLSHANSLAPTLNLNTFPASSSTALPNNSSISSNVFPLVLWEEGVEELSSLVNTLG
jgi:hypothetical protein